MRQCIGDYVPMGGCKDHEEEFYKNSSSLTSVEVYNESASCVFSFLQDQAECPRNATVTCDL